MAWRCMALLLAGVGCGRIGFAPWGAGVGDASSGDGRGDALGGDASGDGAPDASLACLAWQAKVAAISGTAGASWVASTASGYGVLWSDSLSFLFTEIASGATIGGTPTSIATFSSGIPTGTLVADGAGWAAAWSEDRGATSKDLFLG